MNHFTNNSKHSILSKNPLRNVLKGIIVMLLFTLAQCALAQVGVGNTNPQSTLDITASNASSPTNSDGILIPRVSNFPSSNPTVSQDGMLIFYTGSGASGKGFYYWNGTTSNWVFLSSGGKNTLDEAYDEGGAGAGRSINVDNGRVDLAGTSEMLSLFSSGITNNSDNTLTINSYLNSNFNNGIYIGLFGTNPTNSPFLGSTDAIENYIRHSTTNGITTGLKNSFVLGVNSGTNALSTGYRGVLNDFYSVTNTNGKNIGIENLFSRISNRQIGLENYFRANATLSIGVWNHTQGNLNSEHIGVYNQLNNVTGTSNTYGVRTSISGVSTGSKYGNYIDINSTAGGTHYGIYSSVTKTNSYAGYFRGRVSLGTGTINRYLMPETDGSLDQIIKTDGSGQLSFVDASSLFTSTDDQDLTAATLTGTTLNLSIENGTGTSVNLASLQDGTGSDDQTIDTFNFNTTTNELTLEIENDGITPQTVNLSSLNTSDVDWYEEGTTSAPNSINDNIFTQGNVGIGDSTPDASLNIEYSGAATKAAIIDFSTTTNITPPVVSDFPAGLTVNTTATAPNRVLASGLFTLSGTMANGTSTAGGLAVYNTVTTQDYTYGLGIAVDAISDKSYGLDIQVISSPSTINYGIQNIVSGGSNANYGSRTRVTGASIINYGVYSSASGATTNWAGYFGNGGVDSGNVYIEDLLEVDGSLNYTDGNEAAGFILESNATGDANWVDPSTVFVDTDTDEQTIDNFNFNTSTNVLTLEIENDGIAAQTVDLSSLVQTDEIDWYEESSTNKPNAITDDIYTQGYVAIGKNTADYSLDIEDNSAAATRGINIIKTDNSSSETSGLYISKTGSGIGRSHGVFTDVTGSGTGQKYGAFNRITSSANGSQYGTRNFINGDTSSNQFGVFNNLANDGTGDIYGTYNGMRVTSPTNMHGVYNEFNTANSGSTLITGVRNRFTNGTPGTDGFAGTYTDFALTANGTYYGVRNEYSSGSTGTGTKYGSYNLIPSGAGGTHYGVYSDATKSNSYAGYFLGRLSVGTTTANNYILPASRGTNSQVMTTNGTGVVTWQTPTNGDITAVTAGAGLTGGNTAGAATITAAANNGLNVDGGADRIQLGGPLTEDTTIAYGNFDTRFNLNNNGDFIIQDNGTGIFEINDVGTTTLGRDMVWRDENTSGTILAQMLDDGNDARFILREDGNINVDLDTNTGFVFNEQGLDRDFRIESDTWLNIFRVDAGNNRVGIGTATPDYLFSVNGTANLREDQGTGAALRVQGDEALWYDGTRFSWGFGGTSNTFADDVGIGITAAPAFRLDVRENVAANYVAQIRNTNTGNDADGLRIQLGATTPGNANNFIGFLNSTGAFRGRIDGTATGVGYNTTSDRRLKTNIKDINNALTIINKIQPRLYEYKEYLGTKEYGFIAQELQLLYPQAVTGSPNSDVTKDPMMVDYGRLTPILTAGIKELNNKMKKIEAENAILKAKLNQLESLEARILVLENKTVTTQVNKLVSKE